MLRTLAKASLKSALIGLRSKASLVCSQAGCNGQLVYEDGTDFEHQAWMESRFDVLLPTQRGNCFRMTANGDVWQVKCIEEMTDTFSYCESACPKWIDLSRKPRRIACLAFY